MANDPPQHPTPRKNFRVRAYEPADHAAVVDIFVAAIRQYPENRSAMQPHWQQLIDETISGDLADIPSTYFATGGQYLVATCEREDGGQGEGEDIVGMVALRAESNKEEGELKRMSVHPSYHRCGIGRLLVTTLEQWAKDHAFMRVWLATGRPVVDAQRFYTSLGYEHYETKMLPVGVELLFYEKRF